MKAPLPKAIEGGDITHLLTGSSDPVKRPREPLVFHFPHYQGDSPHSAILSGHMKLIHFYETGENLLFDLEADIGERSNLLGGEETQARKPMLQLATSLAEQLADYLSEVGAEMPKPNPNYDPNKEPVKKGGRKKK